MNKRVVCTALLCATVSGQSVAGLYTDEVSKCLVSSTSEADKNGLVKWMFAAAALHPAVKSIAKVTDAQRKELNQSTARMFERLLTVSCKTQMQQALKYEGAGVFEQSFQVLGQVAGRGLFADPAVSASMSEFNGMIDKAKLEQAFGKN